MSTYSNKLDKICEWICENNNTSGARALTKIVMDLEGDGPVGGLLFSLDRTRFQQVIDLFEEFKRTGREDAFNTIHGMARERISNSAQ